VSSIDLPEYLFNSGLISKLSTWLTPPHKKIQITDFAFGVSVGVSNAVGVEATPSRKSMAPSARPVKPMPVSTRNERRVMPGQQPDLRIIFPTPGHIDPPNYGTRPAASSTGCFGGFSRVLRQGDATLSLLSDEIFGNVPRYTLCYCPARRVMGVHVMKGCARLIGPVGMLLMFYSAVEGADAIQFEVVTNS